MKDMILRHLVGKIIVFWTIDEKKYKTFSGSYLDENKNDTWEVIDCDDESVVLKRYYDKQQQRLFPKKCGEKNRNILILPLEQIRKIEER
jgi:calcineurin-like phosphoesterase family protein